MKTSLIMTFLAAAISFSAFAQETKPEFDPAKWQAKKEAERKACVDSQYNTASLTLPEWMPGQAAPQLSDAQKALVHDCVKAGIMHWHHRHHHEAQTQN